LGLVEPQQEVGEADNCAAALVAAPSDGLWQRVVGAMCKRVAVDDKEGAGHLVRRCSFSSTTSMGFLSSRNPRNAGCRISPPPAPGANSSFADTAPTETCPLSLRGALPYVCGTGRKPAPVYARLPCD